MVIETNIGTGAARGETWENPHPRALMVGQGGEEGGELPHHFLGPKNTSILIKTFVIF